MKQGSIDGFEADGGFVQSRDRTLRSLLNHRLKRAASEMQADLQRVLKPYSLRMLSFLTLTVIVDNPGIRLAQVAELLSMERPNLVSIVDQLEKSGAITRDADPKDRRALALNPTSDGLELYRVAMQDVRAHEKQMTEELTPEELEVLQSALLKLARAGMQSRTEA